MHEGVHELDTSIARAGAGCNAAAPRAHDREPSVAMATSPTPLLCSFGPAFASTPPYKQIVKTAHVRQNR